MKQRNIYETIEKQKIRKIIFKEQLIKTSGVNLIIFNLRSLIFSYDVIFN
jgi:hypothetical protein